MLVEPGLELVASKTSVAVHRAVVVPPDGGPVDHRGGGALPRDWAVSSLVQLAVTGGFNLVIALVEQLCVVLVNVALQVGHTSIADLDCILVKDLVEWVAWWEIFTDNF